MMFEEYGHKPFIYITLPSISHFKIAAEFKTLSSPSALESKCQNDNTT